jgi:hypothetical protein
MGFNQTVRSPVNAIEAAPAISGPVQAYWALRIGAALCYIGHGAFGLITKAEWVPYFGVVGISEGWAWKLMPLVGAIDVTVGMAVLFAPRGIALGYMTMWALWTAMLRPLAGESVFEAFERAGNYGVPFALILLATMTPTWYGTTRLLDRAATDGGTLRNVARVLKWTTVLLLFGHGALGAITGKDMLTAHYAAIGLSSDATAIVGWFEIAVAAVVAMRPAVPLLLGIVAWKLATEYLFVVAGAPIWEFVERAGSYTAPLALAALIVHRNRR